MNTERPCGCKGIRTCLRCEADFHLEKPSLYARCQNLEPWTFCPQCSRLYNGWDTKEVCSQHPEHQQHPGMEFAGVLVRERFISPAEGELLISELDKLPWAVSQSGRRKQNYGPKTNFNKRKLRNGQFDGFPRGTRFVQDRLREEQLLSDFQTIEQCSLEYDPTKGASIDPHIDDCWIWGERVVTVNCLADSVLTLTHFAAAAPMGGKAKYNLDVLPDYQDKLIEPLVASEVLERYRNICVRIPMPNLSLIVLYGPARYQYEHAVLREDVTERRVCIAYREFPPLIKDPDTCSHAERVVANAQHFWENDKILKSAV